MSRNLRTLRVTDPAARAALASPTRLEILGQFLDTEGTSVSEIAERMGRRASSIHYHVRLLADVGLLVETGVRRKGKRDEILYSPAAERLEVGWDPEEARRTLAASFRMAERDLAHAMAHPAGVCEEGEERNLHAYRFHARLTPRALARLNRHIDAIQGLLVREAARRRIPADADRYVSLTLALLPLRGRQADPETP